MPRHETPLRLPLLFSGLPRPVLEWLRAAGLPAVRFRAAASLSRQEGSLSGQMLLFDSRSATGRTDAKAAGAGRARLLDAAELLEGTPVAPQRAERPIVPRAAQPARRAFLERLKESFERAGGTWIRLADYPFPYQSVRLRAEEIDPDGSRFQEPRRVRDVQARYLAGLPVLVPAAEGTHEGTQTSDPTGREPGGFADELPLLWKPPAGEFARWWRVRAGLSVCAWRQGDTYHFRREGDAGGFRPMLELWIGAHVASLPLDKERMTAGENGLVLARDGRRHPAGLAALWRGPLPDFGNLPIPEGVSA